MSLPRSRPRKPSPASNPMVMASRVIVQVLIRLAGPFRGRWVVAVAMTSLYG
ncbi:Uncharacterised protein [Mycobacterium tuberculosis]|uniref:Uncharacterized protein n=2 Tax=Mycobacterium tuberculosis TaxID=1773 RepID=A0A0U0SPC8_MYCTX|nr:Uncharacterised protein [Mycobacterium tuberculosis]CKQ33912.1 Uncharacterised protein [Mycobacterium tuberculosis]CKS05740.1 Uncharacterised protein [Mycobacterium tuberculosis]CKS11835.1 Uncharacterised protein [Mycobacterium tuberculosis]CKS96911.1 Uncharacterised protein [Mycobacterium tuberculosis]